MTKVRRPGYSNGRRKMEDGLNNYQDAVDTYEREGYQELGKDQGYQFEGMADTKMTNVKVDPKLKEAQMAALQDLRDRSKSGMSLRDKADLQAMQDDLNSQNRGRQDALRAEFAARGGQGGAAEAVLRAKSMQADQTRAARSAQEVAARAEQNRMNATQGLGQMSGSMRSQEFGEQAAVAEAQDRIAQYNNSGRNQASRDTWNENAGRARQNNQNYMGFQQNKMQANQGAAQVLYNSGSEDENRKMLEAQERQRRKKGQMGAFMGTAGAVVGGVYGGPAGASAGYAAGNAVGQSFAHGGKVKGPEVIPGDHPANDVIPVTVSAGEVVVPKSMADDGEKAKEFVDALNGNSTGSSNEETIQNLFGTIEALLSRAKR